MKKSPTNSKKNQQGRNNPVQGKQKDYIEPADSTAEPAEDCIDGDCFDLGGQKTFIEAFDVQGMGLPSNRLEVWIAQRLINHSHVDIDWWHQETGSSECRPLIMSLRDKGWPIDDHWVSSPKRKLPGRYVKHWFLVPEFRVPIFKMMDEAGLTKKPRHPKRKGG